MQAWLALAWVLHGLASLGLALHGLLYLRLASARSRLGTLADPTPPEGPYPTSVTIQVAVRNEGPLVAQVLAAVANLDWPRDRLEVQLLDDSDPPEAAQNFATVDGLRTAGLDIRQVRRDGRAGFKAGALQNGLTQARGDVLVLLDADFLPPRDLLRRIVPHLSDPAVACVQVRWTSRNARKNLLTAAQDLAMAGHFVVEQRVRAEEGSLMSFNSTACAWRKSAIEAVGGWPARTLAEDLDLSARVLLAGGRFVYVEACAAPALLPERRAAFTDQQARWARGSMQNARLHSGAVLRSRHLGAADKLAVLHHLWHYSIYPLMLLVLVLQAALAWATDVPAWYAWSWIIPAVVGPLTMYAVALRFLRGHRGSPKMWHLLPLAIVGLGLAPRLAWAAVRGLAGKDAGNFVRTRKGAVAYRADPTCLAAAALVAAWAVLLWPWGADPLVPGVLAFGAASLATAFWP